MFDKNLERLFLGVMMVTVVVSAAVGWALVEGLIWLFNNVSISLGGS